MRTIFIYLVFSVFCFSQELSLSYEDSLEQDVSSQKTIMLSKFTKLKLSSGVVAKIVLGDAYKIVLSGNNKNLFYKQKDSILDLKNSKASFSEVEIDTILVYYQHSLDEIVVEKNSFLKSDDIIRQISMDISVSSGGVAMLAFDTERINFRAFNGGSAFLFGRTTVLSVFVGKSSVFEAENLMADIIDVKASKGGIAYVYGNKLVEADVFTKGRVRIYGRPKKIIERRALGGLVFIME